MKLRHKKPLNSYVGQTNHNSHVTNDRKQDSNDQDYQKLRSKQKNSKAHKSNKSDQKTKLCAKILCNFINSINKKHPSPPPQIQIQHSPPLQADQLLHLPTTPPIKQASASHLLVQNRQLIFKQQQIIQKTLEKVNKKLDLTKKIKKQHHSHKQQNKNKKSLASEIQSVLLSSNQKSTLFKNPNVHEKTQLEEMTQELHSTIKSTSMNFQNTHSLAEGLLENFSPFQIPFPSNPNISDLINYQLFFGINPYIPINLGLVPKVSPVIPFSQLPFCANFPESFTKNQKNERQVKEKEKEEQLKDRQKTQPMHLKSKCCYHIGIAYNIHFSKLKQKGLTFTENINYQTIDPTYPAKLLTNPNISRKKESGANMLTLLNS